MIPLHIPFTLFPEESKKYKITQCAQKTQSIYSVILFIHRKSGSGRKRQNDLINFYLAKQPP